MWASSKTVLETKITNKLTISTVETFRYRNPTSVHDQGSGKKYTDKAQTQGSENGRLS